MQTLIRPVHRSFKVGPYITCDDQAGGWGPGPGVRTRPLKNQKNIGFLSNFLSGSSIKSQSYQASIQCWAIIGTPAKRRLIGDDGQLLVVFGDSFPSSANKIKYKNNDSKNVNFVPPLAKVSGSSAHETKALNGTP